MLHKSTSVRTYAPTMTNSAEQSSFWEPYSSLAGLFLIVPTGTLLLPWLRLFRAFSSVVTQMPGHNSQRQGTARTIPIFFPPGTTQPIVGVYFTALFRALASSRTKLLDHKQRPTTVGRTPLNE